MRHWPTLPPGRSPLIVALLLFGVILLPGCDIPAFQKILCDDCPASNFTNTTGTFNIQYLDCDENVKSTRLTIGGFQVERIDDCLKIIKMSPVLTTE